MANLNWTDSVLGSFAWRPGVFEPESDGGQWLVESFDDVDAATFVPFITVRVLATVIVRDVQISSASRGTPLDYVSYSLRRSWVR